MYTKKLESRSHYINLVEAGTGKKKPKKAAGSQALLEGAGAGPGKRNS